PASTDRPESKEALHPSDHVYAPPANFDPIGGASSSPAAVIPASIPGPADDAPIVQANTAGAASETAAAPANDAARELEPSGRNAAAPGIDADALLERGDQFLRTGDIGAARLFYERAFGAGSAAAATRLARTYDPLFLREHGVLGVRGDIERSQSWYRKASESGGADAAPRSEEIAANLATSDAASTATSLPDPSDRAAVLPEPHRDTRDTPSSRRNAALYRVQFAANRSETGAAAECSRFAALAVTEITTSQSGGRAWYLCRTAAPLARKDAAALVATVKANMNSTAVMVADAPQ
ncbi:MAG: hypothetical protein JO010_02085, partial [Alphaproteobacteria bacterium]|nr:hypothetical protein [Alphaproteobacteria bacterium]